MNESSRLTGLYRVSCFSIVLGLMLSGIISPSAVAAGSTWSQTSAPHDGGVRWVSVSSSSDGTRLSAASWFGGIWTSKDSGSTWIHTNAPSVAWRSMVASANGTKWAAAAEAIPAGESSTSNGTVTKSPGSLGGIWTSIDSGMKWTQSKAPRDASWSSISSSSDGTKMAAVVSPGGIWTSIDAGVNWAQTNAPRDASWSSIASSSDGTKLAAVAQATGGIWTSIDSGVNWIQSKTAFPYNMQWQSITTSSDGTKMAAVTNDGWIFTSKDSGANWIKTSAPDVSWRAIASSASGTKLVAVAQPGGVWTSKDSGVNWNEQIIGLPVSGIPQYSYWTSIASSSDGNSLVAVAENFGIYTYQSAKQGTNSTAIATTKAAKPKVSASVAPSVIGPAIHWQYIINAPMFEKNGGCSQNNNILSGNINFYTRDITSPLAADVQLQNLGNGKYYKPNFLGNKMWDSKSNNWVDAPPIAFQYSSVNKGTNSNSTYAIDLHKRGGDQGSYLSVAWGSKEICKLMDPAAIKAADAKNRGIRGYHSPSEGFQVHVTIFDKKTGKVLYVDSQPSGAFDDPYKGVSCSLTVVSGLVTFGTTAARDLLIASNPVAGLLDSAGAFEPVQNFTMQAVGVSRTLGSKSSGDIPAYAGATIEIHFATPKSLMDDLHPVNDTARSLHEAAATLQDDATQSAKFVKNWWTSHGANLKVGQTVTLKSGKISATVKKIFTSDKSLKTFSGAATVVGTTFTVLDLLKLGNDVRSAITQTCSAL